MNWSICDWLSDKNKLLLPWVIVQYVCQPLFFVFFIIESWIFILQRVSTLFLSSCSCLILFFWPPSHQHLIGPHNESSSEQLPNVSSTTGISLRSFICLIYHEITRERASASHNVACQQIIQLCLSIWKRGCVYKKNPLSLSRLTDLTSWWIHSAPDKVMFRVMLWNQLEVILSPFLF